MGKNVAVFVDVANIFYAAKAAGVDIDYVTLLKSATAGRDLVRAYAYTGLDPDNENQRNFHDFLRRSNYKVVSKDIRKYGDGKVKANLDIELVVDMMKTARNLDIAIVVSGDGDFAPAIRAVQEQGVRVEVVSFRGNTSSDLIDVADQFTDIVQLARVEKGSRSGRRVAEDDADLSMTEVPDKMTEGSGAGRTGRSRGRGRVREGVPAATARGREHGRLAAVPSAAAAPVATSAGLVALPGERLARAGGLTEADLAAAEVFTLDEPSDTTSVAPDQDVEALTGQLEDGEPRRRRRRGGRGRGRGRGRADELPDSRPDELARVVPAAPRPAQEETDEDEEPRPSPRAPKATPFGSVWDSQIGTPVAPAAASLTPLADDEDFDEPEIPEYLIAEQRRGAQRGGAGRGARGGRSAYQSAMDRERYGGGGRGGAGGGAPRGGAGGGGGGRGINRYPDVSNRPRPVGPVPAREERSYARPERGVAPAGRSSSEPWSDVPPELEALLRAQVAQKPAPGRPDPRPDGQAPGAVQPALDADSGPAGVESDPVTAPLTTRSRTPRRASADSARGEAAVSESTATAPAGSADAAAETPPKRRPGRPRKVAAPDTGEAPATETGVVAPSSAKAPAKPRAASKPRTTRKATADVETSAETATAPAAPKRRTSRKAASAEPA